MSSFISIGFVFEKDQNIKQLFSKFVDFLIIKGRVEKLSYSIDENGDNWNQVILKDYSVYEITTMMIDNFLGKTNITAMIFNNKQINFDISVFKFSKGDFGFLIEIDINQLFKVGDREELEKCSFMIIKFCETVFDIIEYRYSFCDHEVGIEYTWDEFKQFNEDIYSISVIPQNNEYDIKLASWEIDGLTNRLGKAELYPYNQ